MSRRRSNARTLTELALAAPQVVAHRVTRMAASGGVPGARDQREFIGMVTEKQLAFSQAWLGMALQMLRLQQAFWTSLWFGRAPASAAAAGQALLASALAPVHRKAVANARRLNRARR
ncbi:polyhydroxyalkanoate granule-associated phasin [Piscinibacter sakaiensis]|uniref:Proline dehydrogenase n=1 Tax=Piscinibacter sakaiensis TaxID=1547922 RepID=A0A0K8P6B4_PISS1|nr:polyhydroxyalkanoate granule-associated phasin [Piscinibacter sakaiensis]GAP38147.1 proline dehydrogenase [Piscinibacter sakaiensis]